jgi:hypothetical protein
LATSLRAASAAGLLLANVLVFVLVTYLPSISNNQSETFGLSDLIEAGSAVAAWSAAIAYALTLRQGGHLR